MLLKELGEEATYYYHPDHLGSVSVVSNHRGEPYERVEYLPFGEIWIEETDPATGYIPFRFTSKELDEETGLYYYGARYYEPATSRWMSPDPAGFELINPMDKNGKPRSTYYLVESLNWYAYVSNNPVKYIDPTGGSSIAIGGAAVAAALAEPTPIGEIIIGGIILGMIISQALENDSAASEKPEEEVKPDTPEPTIEKPKTEDDEPETKDKKDKRAQDLPAENEPNSSDAKSTDDDHGQIRDYGPDGKAKTDYDFGHDHGAGDPHAHDWDWSKTPPRQPGRPLLPEE